MDYKKAITSVEYMNKPDQIKTLHNHSVNNRWGLPERVDNNLTNSAADMIGKQIAEYMSEIRDIRRSMRPVKRESALDREAEESTSYASSQVHDAFPAGRFTVQIGMAWFEPIQSTYSEMVIFLFLSLGIEKFISEESGW